MKKIAVMKIPGWARRWVATTDRADRRESLPVMEDNGRLTGIFICPDVYASYLSRKIVQEIQPVDMSRKGA